MQLFFWNLQQYLLSTKKLLSKISWTKQQQTNGKKWFEMFLCMNSIYAPTFRQISTKLAMRQLKIQKFQASFQLAQLEFFTTNVSKFLCVRARNVSSILSTFAVLLQNLLVKEPLIQPNLKTGISHADGKVFYLSILSKLAVQIQNCLYVKNQQVF